MGAELVGRLRGLGAGILLAVAVVVVAFDRAAMGAALGAGLLAGERRIRLGLSQV
jgi:hypothetical protein